MKRICKVPGCQSPVRSLLATQCEAHRQRTKRHGHPCQQTIGQLHIKPYVKFVERIIERNTSGKIEAGLSELKAILERSVREVLHDFYKKGRPSSRHRVKANAELLKVLQHSSPIQIGITLAAMSLLERDQPHMFVSDRGFRFQLVRRFRALADMNTGSYYNHNTGRVHRVYKDIPVKAIEHMAEMLVQTYKTWLVQVCIKYEAESKRQEKANELIREGFM